MSDELREAIASLPSRIEIPPPPSVDRVRRRGRRRRVGRRVVAGCFLAVAGVGMWGTWSVLAGDGGGLSRGGAAAGNRSPAPVKGDNAYVFSNIEVVYPSSSLGGRMSRDHATVIYDMTWGTNEFPGVYECSWTVYGSDGAVVGERTDAVRLIRFRRSATGLEERLAVSGPAVSADVACRGDRIDSPGGDFGRATPAPGNHDHPRGAFESCPDLEGTLPVDSRRSESAVNAAVKFDSALVKHQDAAIERFADPSIDDPASAPWASTLEAEELQVIRSEAATDDRLVTFGCGDDVAERSWAVTLTDNNRLKSDSMGSATLYLVRRAEGWKVWGSY